MMMMVYEPIWRTDLNIWIYTWKLQTVTEYGFTIIQTW